MNEKCKYCDYVSKCSRICEYNSVVCKLHRSFPKTVDKSYKQLQQENQQLKDNWDKLKEYIGIKLYNIEYLQKLCGCRIDDEIHMILDIIKKEMQELEKGDNND